MNTGDLLSELGRLSERELLIETTIRYLLSLSPEVADAAFRGAILRWFNPEVLEGVLGVGTLSRIGELTTDKKASPKELNDQLRNLRFAQEYPRRGYSFHDLTRELVLSYLWDKEPDFYSTVSGQASKYFDRLLKAQFEQSERGEIDPGEVDWDLGVEWAYHYIIADEQEAIAAVNSFLDSLLEHGRFGTVHAVLQTISEHADAGRVSPDSQAWLKECQLREALANYDVTGLERMASEVLQAPDTIAPLSLKAEATYLLAHGLYVVSRYDEAEHYLKQNIDQAKELEDSDSVLRAVVDLGNVELARQNYEQAVDYFAGALNFHVQELRIPMKESVFQKLFRAVLPIFRPLFFGQKARRFLKTSLGFGIDTPLLVLSPEAWHRQELYLSVEADQEGTTPPSGDQGETPQEEVPEALIFYFIEFDAAELGIDTTDLSEAEAIRYQWPVDFDSTMAQLWLYLGYSCKEMDQNDAAAACGRLAGQMYSDLDDLSGTQAAVQFLRGLGVNVFDLEYVQVLEELQHELLNMAVARKDQSAVLQGLINQADSQLGMDKYEEAKLTYEKACSLAESLRRTNEKATCIDGMAKLKWIEGEYDQAVDLFRRAVELYDQIQFREASADSLISLGDLYVDRDQLVEAEECYLLALYAYEQLKVPSGRFNSLLGLSGVRMAKGDYEGSLTYLDQALQLSRSRQDTRLYLQAVALSHIANLHLSLGNVDCAQDMFDQALAITERIANEQLAVSILLDRANTLSSMAEYASAVEMYDQVIQRDPKNSYAYSGKGWALEYCGRERAADARGAYEEYRELRPNDSQAYKNMANALRMGGDAKAAAIEYRRTADQIEREGTRPNARYNLAWCYHQLGEYEKAEELYRQVVESISDRISAYFDFGLMFFCCDRYSEALQAYEQGIGFLQQKYPPRCRLGLIHVAILDLQETIKEYPKLSDVEECDRVQELLSAQQKLAQNNPEDKPNGE